MKPQKFAFTFSLMEWSFSEKLSDGDKILIKLSKRLCTKKGLAKMFIKRIDRAYADAKTFASELSWDSVFCKALNEALKVDRVRVINEAS